ncbi:flagellar hook-length control protein FliK [Variovorax sp. PAMC28562]|uniref:flagellar hook-length control protein FliK n=1 Tax=Variovorax sp. PAMC28562 TaxID=2762323 RepID=UPI00164E5833|nr:flagellar hook-length control protein FliK [Variovorax sp. PAMC28562]QNK74340.1 flagellar hook-length control protein FliK [Variovorax sp. PAMC28562]
MAIEIARSNEVPAASGAARGRSGSNDKADGVSSFAAALASADREPSADAMAASRPAQSNGGADRSGEQGATADTASPSDAASAAADRDKADRRDAASAASTASADAVGNAATNAVDNAAPTAPTPAADASALLLAQSNLNAVSASSALDAGSAAMALAQQAGNGLSSAPGRGGATTLPDSTVAGLTGDGRSAVAKAVALPETVNSTGTVKNVGTVKDTGTVDSHSAALGVALLDRTGGKKDGVKDLSRTATTQDASTPRIPNSTAATAAAAASTDAAAASRVAVSATATPAAETVALAQAAAASIPGEGASPWRRIERPGDASTPAASAVSVGFDATGSASSSTATTDAAAAAANAGAGSAEFIERMVDQVSWWMAHRSQGAELKLDLPGGQPVSVSVQVQGNEAQVAFRSDHPEARQWLNAAMPQLKEMLGNEGLMLSGSSVGQSGSGAEQEAARDAQRAWRAESSGSGTATSTIDTSMTTAPRPRTVSERALDLYV